MKLITDFEPGDGTRYVFGFSRISKEDAKGMGWGTSDDVVALAFNTGNTPFIGIMRVTPNTPVCTRDIASALEIDIDNRWTIVACLLVMQFVFGIHAFGADYKTHRDLILTRWNKDWTEQLRPIVDQGHPASLIGDSNLGNNFDNNA